MFSPNIDSGERVGRQDVMLQILGLIPPGEAKYLMVGKWVWESEKVSEKMSKWVGVKKSMEDDKK